MHVVASIGLRVPVFVQRSIINSRKPEFLMIIIFITPTALPWLVSVDSDFGTWSHVKKQARPRGPLDFGLLFSGFCQFVAEHPVNSLSGRRGGCRANQNLALQPSNFSRRVTQACFPEAVQVYSPPFAHVGGAVEWECCDRTARVEPVGEWLNRSPRGLHPVKRSTH